MEKQYPTDGEIDFLVAEIIRPEPGGKLSILGFYPGNEIKLNSLVTTPPQLQLGILFVLNDGSGAFDCKLLIGVPGEKEKQEISLHISEKLPNKAHTVAASLAGFVVPREGVYTFSLVLDDRIYERKFNILFPKEEAAAK